jgi:hypothetical protein
MDDKMVPKPANNGLVSLAAMLERYAILHMGSKAVIMEQRADGALTFYDERSFLLIHRNNVSTILDDKGKPKTVKVAELWLTHPSRRTYRRVVYDMPGCPEEYKAGPEDYNAYRGFKVQPKAGNWERNKAHIKRIICCDNDEHYLWVLNWMAAMIQRPGQHAFAAIVLIGEPGTGKGHFVTEMLGRCFHPQQFVAINGAGQLTEKFNEILSGKVLVFPDESTWGGDHRAVGRLKALVTESHVMIERKFLPAISEPSHLHIVISSNENWPVPVGKHDRRFLVMRVSEERRQDTVYFADLRAELDAGGRAAMLAELLAWPIREEWLTRPPGSEEKAALALRGLQPIERWWLEVLDVGYARGYVDEEGKGYDVWGNTCPKGIFHRSYMSFHEQYHIHAREPKATAMEISAFLKKTFYLTDGNTSQNVRVWKMPTLAEMRRRWVEQGFPLPQPWSTGDEEGEAGALAVDDNEEPAF